MEWLNELTNLITSEIPLRDERKKVSFPFNGKKVKNLQHFFMINNVDDVQ